LLHEFAKDSSLCFVPMPFGKKQDVAGTVFYNFIEPGIKQAKSELS
jgi:hypothetical protein